MLPLAIELVGRLVISGVALLVGLGLVAWGRAGHDAGTERAPLDEARERAEGDACVDCVAEPARGDESTVVMVADAFGDWRE